MRKAGKDARALKLESIRNRSQTTRSGNNDLPRNEIVRVLEEEILTGVLKPGARIDERALAERFAVSRTPVRDAIGRLASTGLIEVKPRSGSYVAQLDVGELIQLFEMMADLEGLCARYCAQRMDAEEQANLKSLAEECASIADEATEDYLRANFAFHDAIYKGAKNPYLETLTGQVRRRVAGYRNHTLRLPGRMKRSSEEHFKIAEAICSGDPLRAQSLMVDHVDIKRGDYAPFIAMISARQR